MPELPEVETVKNGLAPVMEGRMIIDIMLRREGLRIPFPTDMKERLKKRKVERLFRRAKYLLAFLDNQELLVIHLGMSGKLTVIHRLQDYVPLKHDHLILELDDGAGIAFNDARRFGMAFLLRGEHEMRTHPAFAMLGPEPLSNGFSGAGLAQSLGSRTAPVKTALLDQRIVAGLGNIYVCEALYDAGINPFRSSCKLSGGETEKLVRSIRDVLAKAIAAGGSTLRDYRRSDGSPGYFQHDFSVYGQEGRPCPRRKKGDKNSHIVEKILQGGRSTYFCPDCQK